MMAERANRVNLQDRFLRITCQQRDKIPSMDESDEKPESLDRYWDPELETLGELLDQLEVDGAMDLEELDGFFTALHCSPAAVPPSEYLLEIFGSGDSLENEEIFPGPESARLVWALIQNHWSAVGDAFGTGDCFIPLLLEDDDGKAHGNSWANGFMRGLEMREDAWADILDDESKFVWLAPIIALAYEHHPNPEMRPYKTPMSEEQREILLKNVSQGVTEIYRFFAAQRQLNPAILQPQESHQGPPQKIGRNDPCYCGSGLKYKKCCGGLKVN
jgi:uncharacterized protein